MIFILNIKFKLLFDILKKKKFVIKADLNDFKTIIEVIIDRKINSSFLLDKQIKSKLFYLKRQWKSLVSRSSGPKYLKFKQMLETEFPIRLNQIDIAGNETEEKIQNISSILNNIHIENKFNSNEQNHLNRKFKKLNL